MCKVILELWTSQTYDHLRDQLIPSLEASNGSTTLLA